MRKQSCPYATTPNMIKAGNVYNCIKVHTSSPHALDLSDKGSHQNYLVENRSMLQYISITLKQVCKRVHTYNLVKRDKSRMLPA